MKKAACSLYFRGIFGTACSFLLFCACSTNPPTNTKQSVVAAQVDSQKTSLSLEGVSDTADLEKNPEIEFAFANSSGDQLIIFSSDSLANPVRFTKVLSMYDFDTGLSFIQKKEKTEKDNGRQNEHNFDDCAGYLYACKKPVWDKSQSQVLVSERFLSERKGIWLNPPIKAYTAPVLSKEQLAKIQSDKGRKIKRKSLIAELANANDKGNIWIIEFIQKKDSALASLVHVQGDKMTYLDFPAKYDETSTWRVDDGGNFGPEYYKIIAAFEYNGKIEIVTDWAGAEGNVVGYYREENGIFNQIKTSSRYTAPL